jgi:hypothetical protein
MRPNKPETLQLERRARRIRIVSSATAVGLLLIALFAVAWLGNARLSAVPGMVSTRPSESGLPAPYGQYLFGLEGALDLAISAHLAGEDTDRATIDAEFRRLLPVLFGHGEMLLYRFDDGTEAWVLFIPFKLKPAAVEGAISDMLAATRSLARRPLESSDVETPDHVAGYYYFDARGLLISSLSTMELPLIEDAPAGEARLSLRDLGSEWRYFSPRGELPAPVADAIPTDALLMMQGRRGESLLVRWKGLGDAPEAEVFSANGVLDSPAGEPVQILSNLWPLIGQPEAPIEEEPTTE